MYKIDEVKLTNFKFFHGDKVISLKRKHAIIYGENGSGKSSIYWGLHCFLHSTLKHDIESVQKYFNPLSETNKESIRNRYAMSDGKNSGVSLKLVHDDNRRYEDIRAEVSNKKVSTQTNRDIKLMTLSSELLNYKVIYNMYTATNRNTIKLFKYFQDNLMEFIDFDQSLTTIHGDTLSGNSLIWWRYIKDGIDPYPGIGGVGYDDFVSHVNLFNEKLSEYLQLITREANEYLQNDFYEEFKIKFKYTPASYNDFNTHNKGRNKRVIAPEIELQVELNNVTEKYAIVERPQSYLNEAKLSSIAIAIRLAMLQERYIEQAPKIMILDDLLLSLDMGNRSALVKLLLKRYSLKYQMIILTHDRVFFDCVLNQLPKAERDENWKILEMYEIVKDGRKDSSIVEYMTPIAKAMSYFKGETRPVDYNACANNQRQALECIFKEQLQCFNITIKKGDCKEPLDIDKMMINHCLLEIKPVYSKIGFDTDIIDELDIHRQQSLNPCSHHNPKSNFYKKEILRTFEIIEILQQHKIEVLVSCDEELIFEVQCTGGSLHTYKVVILDNILIYKKPGSSSYILGSDERCFHMIEYNGGAIDSTTNNMTLQELYEDTYTHFEKRGKSIDKVDVLDNFKYKGKTLRELVAGKN